MKQDFLSEILLSLAALFGLTLFASAQQPLFLGGDVSLLQKYEDHHVGYYDPQGSKITDVLGYLKSDAVGWNALRVRLFVSPDSHADPQVCQDLDYVVRLGRRIKAAGFSFLLDFHYSDTWADPAAQWTPKAWLSLTDEQLPAQVYAYTKDCLQTLVDAGAAPDLIQTGNEISYGMLWGAADSDGQRCNPWEDGGWTRFSSLLTQATKACREVCPEARLIIHTERAGDPATLVRFYRRLSALDYDVIGLSYYPFWHSDLATLSASLDSLAADFPAKKVQIVETAYYYQWQPSVGDGIDYDYSSTWPITPAGQASYAQALIDELKRHANVEGLYWWFPEENGNGPNNAVLKSWLNRGLWHNSTHRALPALYVLKSFLDRTAAIEAPHEGRQGAGRWFDLQGRALPYAPSRHGVYLWLPAGSRRSVKCAL